MRKSYHLKECKHLIGMMHDTGGAVLITEDTLDTLLEAVQDISNTIRFPKYTRAQYCDPDVPTNLYRFTHCPRCGKKIDWEKIKNNGR